MSPFGRCVYFGGLIVSVMCLIQAKAESNGRFVLTPGMLEKRQIHRGEVHAYTLALPVGRYVRLSLDQLNIDVSLAVVAPDGQRIAIGNASAFGREDLCFVTEEPGAFRVEVSALGSDTNAGSYRLIAGKPRSVRGEDRKGVEAQRIFTDAQRLADENTADAFSRAAARFHEAASIWASIREPREEARAQFEAANVYHKTAEYERAHHAYSRALQLLRNSRDPILRVETSRGRAQVEGHLGKKHQSTSSAEEELAFWRKVGDRRGEASRLISVASSVLAIDPRKSRNLCNLALELYRKLGDRRGEGKALERLGTALIALRDYQKALEPARQWLEISRELSDRRGEAAALTGLGTTLVHAGRYEEALAYLEESRALRHQMGDRSAEHSIVRWMAQACWLKGERKRSLALLEQSLIIRDEIRASLTKPTWRAGLEALYGEEDVVLHLMETHEMDGDDSSAARAFEVAETGRSRFFVEASPPAQGFRLAEIQRKLVDDDTLLLEYCFARDAVFLWAITRSTFSAYRLPNRPELERLARTVYDLLTARNRIVRGETASQRAIRIAQADLDYPKGAAALSHALLGPVSTLLEKRRLLVVSDGVLQYIPFGSLPDLNGKPLVENHEIVNLPSAAAISAMQSLAERQAPRRLLTLLADPVFDGHDSRLTPGAPRLRSLLDPELVRATRAAGFNSSSIPRLAFAGQEAREILKLAPSDKVLTLRDFEATREAFLATEVRDSQIIHIIAHGLINDDDPDLSGIVLSLVDPRGRRRDGFLRLRDIYGLKVSSDLVVLSACQTALGKVLKGNALIGLTAAFLRAGAARVVSTTWKVDDEASAELMKAFYAGLWGPKNLTPAAALRAAQLSMAQQDKWKSPYYWAGHVLTGQWR